MATDRYAKLNINWMDSEWLLELDPSARLAWVQLICYTKASGIGGTVKAKSPRIFGIQNFIEEIFVTQMIDAATQNEALKIQDGVWILTGWDKHQRQTGAERMAEYREKKRVNNVNYSTDVTTCDSHVTDVTKCDSRVTDVTKCDNSVTDVTGVTNVTREERRGEEKRREENPLHQDAHGNENESGSGGGGGGGGGGGLPEQMLAILRQLPGIARAKSETPTRLAEVVADHPSVPDTDWPRLARECRDWASTRSSLGPNSVFALSASSLLREFMAKVHNPKTTLTEKSSRNGQASTTNPEKKYFTAGPFRGLERHETGDAIIPPGWRPDPDGKYGPAQKETQI